MGTIHRVAAVVLLVAAGGCGDGLPSGEGPGPTTEADATSPQQATDPTPTVDPAATTAPEDLELAGVDFGVLDLPEGEPYEEYVLLTDDTGVVEVEVPKAWTEVETAPRRTDEAGGTEEPIPYIGAATDIDGFYRGWTASGALVANNPTADSEQSELDLLAGRTSVVQDCVNLGAWDYDDGTYTGLAEMWTGCGPSGAAQLAISTFIKGEHLLVVVQLLTDADIDAAMRVIETFGWAD
ncbi:MAG: hypothetical protein R2754_16835 [Microthrixaceae bacterium]